MSVTRKFGLGIVGAGNGAKPHALALGDLTDLIEVRGVYARDTDKLGRFCDRYQFPAAQSIEAMMQDDAIDAMLIVTPPNARAGIVDAAVRAGKHVLMEKPIERTTAAAKAMVEQCEAAGLKLGIVFQHRFRQSSMRAKALLEGGTLGRIGAVNLVVPWWRPQSYYDEPGRGTLARDGGGVLISQAIHPLDLLLDLAGPVGEVQAIAGTTLLHRMETEDFAAGGMRFANGAFGSLMATTASFPGDAEFMLFNCENATMRLAGGALSVRWRDGREESFGEETSSGGGADPMAFPHDWHRSLHQDFVAAVRENRQPLSNGRSALRVHRLIDALLASSAQRQAVTVEQD